MFPNSDDPSVPHPEPRPALALAVTALERALKLVSEGKITLATILADSKKKGKLIATDINPSNNKRQLASVSFSEGLWGTEVADYCTNILGLRKSDMDTIIFNARKFARATSGVQNGNGINQPSSTPTVPTKIRSARANIPLNYDSDSNGEDDEDSGDEAMQRVGQDEESEEDVQPEDDTHPVEDHDGNECPAMYVSGYADDDVMDYEDGHVPEPEYEYEDEDRHAPEPEFEYMYEDGHALEPTNDMYDDVSISPVYA